MGMSHRKAWAQIWTNNVIIVRHMCEPQVHYANVKNSNAKNLTGDAAEVVGAGVPPNKYASVSTSLHLN